MSERKFRVTNASQEKLVGIEVLPSSEKKKYPTVILVSGFGSTKEESRGMFTELAQRLAGKGFCTYRFDFSGLGESEGDYSETSISKLKSDLSIILDFVRTQALIDQERIGIVAQSLGSTVTVALEPKVKTMILMGAPSHLPDLYARLFGSGYNPSGISTRVHSDGRVTKMKAQFFEDMRKHQPLESITRIHCPILFIHAENDNRVPLSDMEAYFKRANAPKEKIILQGANHGFHPGREEMYAIATSWFEKHL